MDTSTILGGGLAIEFLTSIWSKIKLYFVKIYSLFFIRMSIKDETLKGGFIGLLNKEFKQTKITTLNFFSMNVFVKAKDCREIIAIKDLPQEPTIWWKNKKPIIISAPSSNNDNEPYAQPSKSSNSDMKMSLTFIRGTFDPIELVKKATKTANELNRHEENEINERIEIVKYIGSVGRQSNEDYPDNASIEVSTGREEKRILKWYEIVGYKPEELGYPTKQKALSYLYYPKNVEHAVNEIKIWKENQKWFESKSIPWKRGILLWGAPGTGKTAFVRAIAQELNMPICSFDLSTMNNSDLQKYWGRAMNRTPCIVLFEDIDAIFDKRENIACKGLNQGLSFDCLLNTMDGVENTNGVLTFVTTNHLDSVDPAIGGLYNGNEISTRPGRIDSAVEFANLDDEGRSKMAERILGDFDRSIWEHLLKKTKDTGAQFQERCCKLALNLFWEQIQENKP